MSLLTNALLLGLIEARPVDLGRDGIHAPIFYLKWVS